MQTLITVIEQIERELMISQDQLTAIAKKFKTAMEDSLADKDKTLKMLPSFLSVPTGRETGQFLAIDFGGTNVRVLSAQLAGKGQATITAQSSRPLKAADGSYNHIAATATAEQLFDFIAAQVAALVPDTAIYPLGHTFSFPAKQLGLNEAYLMHWTKEIATAGVENQDINQLLAAALARRQLSHVRPQVVLNDTVGTLLTSAYSDTHTDIGSICGTGHNTAYVEAAVPGFAAPMVINIESGNFNQLPFTRYDDQLDAASEQPGAQRLEKMTSGRYVGELLQIIVLELLAQGLFTNQPAALTNVFQQPAIFNGADVACLLADETTELTDIAAWLERRFTLTDTAISERQVLKRAAAAITLRSARLIAATFIGILLRIDPTLSRPHTIAVDGSLYEKMPGYAAAIEQALAQVFPQPAFPLTTRLTKDGSGLGAAIAVASAVAAR